MIASKKPAKQFLRTPDPDYSPSSMPPDTELKGVEGKYVYVTVLSGLNVLQPGASYYHGLKGEEEIQLYASVQVKGKISLCAPLKRSSSIFLIARRLFSL